MKKLVSIDSNVFIWGIRGVSSPGQEANIPKAKALLSIIDEKEYSILLPAPMLAEILSPVPANEQPDIMGLLDKRFQIVPFDAPAAAKCAELLHKSYTDAELKEYRVTNSVPKAKLKYDCMIASICIVRKVECIYTDDPDIARYCDGQIVVRKIPIIAPTLYQTDLFGGMKPI